MRRALLLVMLVACDDALDQRLAIVTDTRVLAIVAEPAEAKPGSDVTYSALVASPDGPVAEQPFWAFCIAPLPPTEDDVVVPACTGNKLLLQLGSGATVTGTLPGSGCGLFGPDTPPGGFRPRSADETGGYYQPVRTELAGDASFGLTRIHCELPNAPPQASIDYLTEYVFNVNPTLLPVQLPATIAADSDVTLTAAWPADSAESYVSYDTSSQTIVPRREAMRVSWYASAGTLPVDATAVAEADLATSVTTTWHTPATPGPAWIWIVLRDSRGGTATQQIAVTIH
jgi:hypothetical protein